MFEDIYMDNYTLAWELQHSYFLKDCLYEEISYKLKESRVIIYKELDNGISEEITLDELIFYIHSEVAAKISSISCGHACTVGHHFCRLFTSIDNIKKAVGNMEIILKYDDEKDEDDENDEDDEDDEDEDEGEAGASKLQDNKSLAF